VTGGEQLDGMGAVMVLGFFVLLMAFCTAAYWILYRLGWLEDPEPWEQWEQTPGARTDRARLLDEGRVQ
jgi:hypothetical protein